MNVRWTGSVLVCGSCGLFSVAVEASAMGTARHIKITIGKTLKYNRSWALVVDKRTRTAGGRRAWGQVTTFNAEYSRWQCRTARSRHERWLPIVRCPVTMDGLFGMRAGCAFATMAEGTTGVVRVRSSRQGPLYNRKKRVVPWALAGQPPQDQGQVFEPVKRPRPEIGRYARGAAVCGWQVPSSQRATSR